MIKLAPLLKEIEVARPFSGRITNVQELEQYLKLLEKIEGEKIYGDEDWSREDIIEEYKESSNVIIPYDITSLYNLKYVKGNLITSHQNSLTSLPNNLTVTNDLHIYNSNISEIPNNLNIGGNLHCDKTPLLKQYSPDEIKQIIIDKGGSVQKVLR